MGARQSSNSQNITSYAENNIRNVFTQNCETNSVCSQSIQTGNINFDLDGNCSAEISNNCSVNTYSNCNMDNAFGQLFEDLKQSGNTALQDHIGNILQDSFDNTNIQTANINDVKNSFNQRCSTNFGAYQRISTGDMTARCRGNATIVVSNNAEDNSNCVLEMVNSFALDDTTSSSSEQSSNTPSAAPPTPSQPQTERERYVIYVVAIIFVFVMFFIMLKK